MRNEDRDLSLGQMVRRVIPSGRLWNPAADVFRSEDGWVVKIDLAGVCSDELEIEIRDSILRIAGCRRDTLYREGVVYQQMEITYSRFEKTIQFPGPVEGASLKHDYRDGFLIINLLRRDDKK
jgi:HSP20 family protein